MMIVVDAINFIVDIDRERDAIKTFVANATAKASRMIRLAHGVKNLKTEIELSN